MNRVSLQTLTDQGFDDDLDDALIDEHTHLIELDEDAQEYLEGVIGSRKSGKSRLYYRLTGALRKEAKAEARSKPGHEDGNELHTKDIYVQGNVYGLCSESTRTDMSNLADRVRDQIWSSIRSSAIGPNDWKDSYCIDSCTDTVNGTSIVR